MISARGGNRSIKFVCCPSLHTQRRSWAASGSGSRSYAAWRTVHDTGPAVHHSGACQLRRERISNANSIVSLKLTGYPLAEANLSPDERANLQQALASKGFLALDQAGPGTHDGEFGPITRKAIKAFQSSLGGSQTGFLTVEQRTVLLDTPEKRAAREAQEKAKRDAAELATTREAARMAAEAKARQEAIERRRAPNAKPNSLPSVRRRGSPPKKRPGNWREKEPSVNVKKQRQRPRNSGG